MPVPPSGKALVIPGPWGAPSHTGGGAFGIMQLCWSKARQAGLPPINFSNFTIARIRALEQAEAGALFDPDGIGAGSGSLYRLNVPGAKKFLHKNSLCGSDDTQWMVTYVFGRALQLAFFSGAKPPVFTADAIANSTDMCGKFGYAR